MTGHEFSRLMRRLTDFFGRKLNEQQMDIWYEHLAPFPEDAGERGIDRVVKEQRSFPALGVVLDAVASQDWTRKGRSGPDMDDLPPINEELNKRAGRNLDRLLTGDLTYGQACENLAVICDSSQDKVDWWLTGDLEKDRETARRKWREKCSGTK